MRRVVAIVALALLCGFVARAESQTFGTWAASVDDTGGVYASTVTDSGHILGQYCDPSVASCYWLLGMSTRCKPGAKYPVLVNSDTAAQGLEVGCTGETAGQAGTYGLVFTDFEAISRIIASSHQLGIAFPLKGDQFRVVRFDLVGASAALAAMRASSSKPRPAPPEAPDKKKL
jgi:hypothetical protein